MGLAFRQWRSPASTETPALFTKLDELGPAKALGIGALIPLINFKNLAIYLPAVAVLAAAPLTPIETVVGVVAVPLVFCGAMLTPLLIYLVMPGRAGQTLARMRRWIETNSHMVARVLLPLIGLALVIKGGTTLWTLFGG